MASQLANILPYSLSRTWHTQLAVLWIATAWLGMGLYIGPAISGHEPKFQRLGVNVLFICLLIIVVGAFTGQWLAVMQKLGLAQQLLVRPPGLGVRGPRPLLADLPVRRPRHLADAGGPRVVAGDHEGRRVEVHRRAAVPLHGMHRPVLWRRPHVGRAHAPLDGGVLALVGGAPVGRGLLRSLRHRGHRVPVHAARPAARRAARPRRVLFATIVFLSGGVLGTLHHLYFTGTPTAVIALGASFSALEVVPLAFIGFEAYHTFKLGQATPWMQRYRWPILFFIAVAFWNLVGAGLFGFLINPPLPLYYMQGLNLTPLHGHTALFGVYGFLGIGLMLFCLRGLRPNVVWNERLLQTSFWALNIGLAGMALLTLLPIGLIQLTARSSTATGTRAPPSSCSSPSSSCWCGCACLATRSSASARCRWPGSCCGCGSDRSAWQRARRRRCRQGIRLAAQPR